MAGLYPAIQALLLARSTGTLQPGTWMAGSSPAMTQEGLAPQRPSVAMKFTLSWLKDHLDTTASLGRDRRCADARRARGRGCRGRQREVQRLRRRAGDRGQATSQRRPPARLHGRRRRRARAGRLRRAQCAHRHEERVLAGRDLHPRQEDHARQGRHPRRRVRTACCARRPNSKFPTITTASSTCRTTRRSAWLTRAMPASTIPSSTSR